MTKSTAGAIALAGAWIHFVVTCILHPKAGKMGQDQIRGGDFKVDKTHRFLIASIVLYIIVAVCAFVAANDAKDEKTDKDQVMYAVSGALAIIVILYHFMRLFAKGESDVMANSAVPMAVAVIAILISAAYA